MCNRRKRELAVEAVLDALPPIPECPICCLPFPPEPKSSYYMVCCGNMICFGCHAGVFKQVTPTRRPKKNPAEKLDITCPFCRQITGPCREFYREDDQIIKQYQKLADKGEARGMFELANLYAEGHGVKRDEQKALELLHKAADLGCTDAIFKLSEHYRNGDLGLVIDKKKHRDLLEKAAAMGHLISIHNIGCSYYNNRHFEAAVCNLRVAASCGQEGSMKTMYTCYKEGHISKEELADTLRAFQAARDEMKSKERDMFKRVLEIASRVGAL